MEPPGAVWGDRDTATYQGKDSFWYSEKKSLLDNNAIKLNFNLCVLGGTSTVSTSFFFSPNQLVNALALLL